MNTLRKLFSTPLLLCLCLLFSACPPEPGPDSDTETLSIILRSNKWITKNADYGQGENYHAWVDYETCILYFTSESEGFEYFFLKQYDTDLGNSSRREYTMFTYKVVNNSVQVIDESGNTYTYNYSNGLLTSPSGLTVFRSSPITSDDKQFMQSIGPKKGSCGNNLKYTYDDRTNELVISGSGRMQDYTTYNQPWHDYYIKNVTIEDGCTYIGTHAFHTDIVSMSSVVLPSTLQEIGDYAFYGTSIASINLPYSLVKIGYSAFANCKYLKDVDLLDNIEVIGDYAFNECPLRLGSLTLPKNLKTIGAYALSSATISNLTLNDKIETIGNVAFANICNSKLVLPNSLKSLGSNVFRGSFSEIRIGEGLNYLAGATFISSKSGKMYVNQAQPIALSNTNIIINSNGDNAASAWILYVPKGCKQAYQKASGWSLFKSIIEDSSLSNSNNDSSDEEDNVYTGKVNGHQYVDLGLSVKWATCNVGADKPEGYGNEFSWGGKSYMDDRTVFKNVGNNISGGKYDTAKSKWGSNWRMPTVTDWEELMDCKRTLTTLNGQLVLEITGDNGAILYLPIADRTSTHYWTANSDDSIGAFATSIKFSNYGYGYLWWVFDTEQDRQANYFIRAITSK